MQFEIKGLDQIIENMNRADVKQEAATAMHQSLALIINKVARYPPPPPASWYRRTGLLGRSWDYTVELSGELVGIAYNTAPYANLVQGLEQTGVHKSTGWKRIDDVAEQNRKTIVQFFIDALERIAAQIAGTAHQKGSMIGKQFF